MKREREREDVGASTNGNGNTNGNGRINGTATTSGAGVGTGAAGGGAGGGGGGGGQGVMQAKAGTGGVRPRPVKKQRMVSFFFLVLSCFFREELWVFECWVCVLVGMMGVWLGVSVKCVEVDGDFSMREPGGRWTNVMSDGDGSGAS